MRHIKRLAWALINLLSDLGASRRWPFFTALAWRLSLVSLPKVEKSKPPQHRVIILDKPGGTDDIVAAYRGNTSRIGFFLLRREMVKKVFGGFLDGRVANYNYLSKDPDTEARKIEYRNYLKKVLGHLDAMWSFSGFISFNIAYMADRELATATSELGKSFILCHKECVKTAIQHRSFSQRYLDRVGPFTGSFISVYNQEEKESMINGRLARPEQIKVVGSARLDFSHGRRGRLGPSRGQKTILYYTIAENAGLPIFDGEFLSDERERFEWTDLASRTSSALFSFARENPDIRIKFKAKLGNFARSRELLGEDLPENVEFLTGFTGHELLKEVDLVIGFNSTAIFEAVAAGIQVVVPMLGVRKIPDYSRMVYDIGDPVTLAYSPEEFNSALLKHLANTKFSTELSAEEQRLLDRFVGNSDGRSGARLRQFISDSLSG